MRFGLHVSVAGGIDKAPQRAAYLGCDCFQVFVSNPRSWKFPEFTAEQIQSFISARNELALGPVTVHATYLPNLASPDTALYEKSVSHIKAQYLAGRDIQADYFVLHPGSSTNTPKEDGIKRIASALTTITGEVEGGPQFLLENTAGGGSSIGTLSEELGEIYRQSGLDDTLIGVCVDTCHAWAAGYDISGRGAFKRLITAYENELYKGCVKLIHCNDCLFGCGEGRDRHAHVGLGCIGIEGMKNILRAGGVKDIAVVLETPIDENRDDLANLEAARKYAGVL